MTTEQIIIVSVNPVCRTLEFYPPHIVAKLETKYRSIDFNYYRTSVSNKNCHLGGDFFNATVQFSQDGKHYQTTPGVSAGRHYVKQPGYRAVRRIVLTPDQTHVTIYSHRVSGEWRITDNEHESEHVFEEEIPIDNIFTPSSTFMETIEPWTPEDTDIDLTSDQQHKYVVVWQWCKKTNEEYDNIFHLGNNCWVPYLQHQNTEIEQAFKNNHPTVDITLPYDGSIRNIIFNGNKVFVTQKDESGTKLRCARRVCIKIADLIYMLDNNNNINTIPFDLSTYINKDEIPHEFICCISQDIMKSPVNTIDGHIYDELSILKWFEHKTTSPLTGLVLSDIILSPNNIMKEKITEFIKLQKTKYEISLLSTTSSLESLIVE